MDSTLPFRVVHLIPHLRGVAGQLVAHLAIEQQRRTPGRIAVVLSADADQSWTTSSPALVDACRDEGVRVFWCGEFFHRDVSLLRDAASRVQTEVLGGGSWAHDAVAHAHTAMSAVVARKARAPRVVATLHGVGRHRPPEYDLQDDLAWTLCDALIVGSEELASDVRDTRGHAQVVVVAPPRVEDVVRRPETGRNGRRIAYAGPLDIECHPDTLVEAMPIVWQTIPDAQLHLIGDGELRDGLTTRAAAVDRPGGRIVIEHSNARSTERLGSFDVFASASETAQPGLEALTALAIGLPIVAPAGSGLAQQVEAGRCGLAVPSGSVRDIGLALTVLLETSENARAELGDAGRRFAAKASGLAAHLDALERIYAAQAPTKPAHPPSKIVLDGPVRLHLGSGGDRRPGWLNVDTRAEATPDLVARVDALPMLADASVDEIEACHLFEHLALHEAHAALREWARVLKPGGRLFLELPNFDACVRILGTAVDSAGYDFGMMGIYGWPPEVERDGDALAHRWGWTPATLTGALESAGFTDVEQLPVTQTYRPATRYDRDFRVGATRAAHDEVPG